MFPLPHFFDASGPATQLPPDDVFANGQLETMRAQGGGIPLWPLHRARLLRCTDLSVELLSAIEAAVKLAAQDSARQPLRLRLRVGVLEGRQRWDIAVSALEPVPELAQGARLYPCGTRLPVSETANSGCKSLSRTRYNRASAELPPDCEGLMLDSEGRAIESLRCNLLVWRNGGWLTPNLGRCGVRGVMRSWLQTRVAMAEADFTLDDLAAADELALCNSLRGVIPVRELIGYQTWSLGPRTRELQQLIAEHLW